jgi:hypothetical protein
LRHTDTTERRTKHKTAESSGVTNGGGKWSDSLHGYTTIEEAWSGMITKKITSRRGALSLHHDLSKILLPFIKPLVDYKKH